MKTRLAVAVLMSLHILLMGCASIGKHTIQVDRPPKLYPGTRMDWSIIHLARDSDYQDSIGKDLFRAAAPFAGIDLPFTAVLDTIFLPIDGLRIAIWSEPKETQVQSGTEQR